MNEQYTFEIGPDLRAARKAVEDFSKKTQQQLDSIDMKTGLSAIKDTFDLASTAFSKVSGFFEKANQEASEAETATRQLNNAMRLSGEFSEFASEQALEYAESLAKVTTASDNQIVSALALAKNYGLSNSEAKKLVQVATDLAAITGQDLNSATQTLAATYNGFISRDLARMIPALKGLTSVQLQSGEAVDLLGQKLKGSAADALNSYTGDLIRARKEVDKFYENIGNVSLRVTAFLIRDTIALKNNIVALGQAIARDSTIGPTIFDQVSEKIKKTRALNLEELKEIDAQKKAIANRVKEAAAAEAKAKLEAFKSDFANQKLQIELASLNEIERINREFLERENKVRKGFSLGLIKTKAEEQALISNLEIERIKKIEKIQAASDKKVLDTKRGIEDIVNSKLNEITNAPLSGLITFAVKGQEELDKTKAKIDATLQELIAGTDIAPAIKRQMIAAADSFKDRLERGFNLAVASNFASTLIKAVKRGADGAADIIAKGVGAAASLYFGKEIGGLFEDIVSFMSQSSDQIKKQINDFERAVPTIINNLLDALPAIFEQVIENMPYVIEKIFETIPKYFETLVTIVPKIITKFVEMMPRIATSFIQGLVRMIPELFKAFTTSLVDAAKGFVEALLKAVTDIGGGISKFTGIGSAGDGGGGGIIGTLLDPLGLFAEGGRVPDDSRFSGDRFPARLDAGEQVFSRDLTKRLEAFLDGGAAAAGPSTIVIKVGETEMARVLLNLNRGGFRTA